MSEFIANSIGAQMFDQFWVTIFCLIPLVLISRIVVTGTRYSPILFVVIFGLIMGYVLVASGVSTPGLPEFQVMDHISKATIIALIASFFVGGQELRKTFGRLHIEHDDLIVHTEHMATIGTNTTHLYFIVRTLLLLLGIDSAYRVIVGNDPLSYYPLLAYICLIGSMIVIEHKVISGNVKHYIRKGIVEMTAILIILIITFYVSRWIQPMLALPQIFFAMLITCSLGAIFYKWTLGPTVRALLFAGMPIVLAGNFIIGGSRITGAFSDSVMLPVIAFGFFGQLLWMFGGISLLMVFAKTTDVRNLAPGLAGGLSHAGLTGACTAGDLGTLAKIRAPIMINLPFLAHIFVFSILAASNKRGSLILVPSVIVFAIGIALTIWALYSLKTVEIAENDGHKDSKEVKALMKFALGWQLTAMFGSFILLSLFGMSFANTAAAATSSLSHFGLFAATQGGMFDSEVGVKISEAIPFIFAMPFLVHPFVFYMFGKAMAREGHMPKVPVFVLASVGIVGVIFAVILQSVIFSAL